MKPLPLQLAEKLDEKWTDKRPGEPISGYIKSDGSLLSEPRNGQFNGHAYELARNCVCSAQRAKEDAPENASSEQILKRATSLLRKEFTHLTTELQAAAEGVGAKLRTYESTL